MKNLNTAFPFYDALDEQTRFKDHCDAVPFIISPSTCLVPFAIKRLHSAGVNTDITLYFYPVNGGSPVEVHGDDAGIVVTSGTTYDYISYNGTDWPAPLPIESGGYYLVVKDAFPATDKFWYSETFGVRSSVSEYFKLEFSNDTQLADILAKFNQIIYLDEFFKAPEYPREDTGEKRDGILVKEKQIVSKTQVLYLPQVPEYLADALILLPLMDIVTVTIDSVAYTFDQVTLKDPEWSDPGYALFAKLELSFINVLAIKKLNFKETGYAGGSMGVIKQGVGVTTIAIVGNYEYNVVFDEDMPDATYTPAATATSIGEMVDAQLPVITNITVHGFLISTIVECAVKWSAIHI